jgi:hypothetical protein
VNLDANFRGKRDESRVYFVDNLEIDIKYFQSLYHSSKYISATWGLNKFLAIMLAILIAIYYDTVLVQKGGEES